MAKVTPFDLALNAEEENLLSRAASLTGTTMADFVRNAAKEKARILLERASRVTLSERDFLAFNAAINGAFAPNLALQEAITTAGQVKRA
jgi:uncharacterized protein (DUF1778 family)